MEWLPILADVGSDLPTAASVIGAAGFSGVLAWYLVTKAIPKLQDQHATTLRELADKFDRQVNTEREYAKTESALWRDMHKAEAAETREAVRDLCNEIRSSTLGRRPPTTAPQS